MKTWFLKKWLKWRVHWSNRKNKNSIIDATVEVTYNRQYSVLWNLNHISTDLYSKFKWTQDSFNELFDRMRTPARCYLDYIIYNTLYDDCDGFHACLMHIVNWWGFDSVLLTYMTQNLNNCHTVLVVKIDEIYYKIDYTRIKTYSSLNELVEDIKDHNADFIDYNLVKFQGVYEIINEF